MQKVIIIVNNINFLFSHRREILVMLKNENFELLVIAPPSNELELKTLDVLHIPIKLSRKGMNPISELLCFFRIYSILRKEKPDIIHLITMKPIIYGGLSAKFLGNQSTIFAFSGLGYIFTNLKDINFFKKLVKETVGLCLRFLMKNKNKRLIFHNSEDLDFIKNTCGIANNEVFLTMGSGVDLKKFAFSPLIKTDKLKILFASRLLKSKGIIELINIAKYFNDNYPNELAFYIAGDPDLGNPDSVSSEYLETIKKQPNINYFPYRKNIKPLIHECHVSILLSYREGLPKFLLESASCGRAIITSNIAGCKECVIDRKTGF